MRNRFLSLITLYLFVFSVNGGLVLSPDLQVVILNFPHTLRRIRNILFFTTQPTRQFRIVIDLGKVLGDVDPQTDDKLNWKDRWKLRDGAVLLIKELKRRGHAIILFTSASREEWNYLKERLPELGIFEKENVYTRDEIQESVITINGREVKYKDIRNPRINGDFLIDDNPDLKLIAEQIKMGNRFIQVPPVAFGEVKPFDWIVNFVVPPIQDSGG